MNVLYDFFWVVWVSAIVLIFAYGFVLLFGAPYFPSLKPHIKAALDILDLKEGQTVYDLGCGDGRFLKAAARAGVKSVGYELNPFVFAYAWLTTRRYGRLVKVRWGNFWKADISQADAVFVFLLDKYMPQLDAKLRAEGRRGLKLASHTFQIPGKKHIAKKYGVFLYKY
ncbi:MAG TPA: class I SAM-dependent methyltransferase [Candidatus Saccharimonadales bacterium]|nr:class I SAM-dependent methyltransferase [Candidatus Saccharimonadales bacterium]